MISAAFYIFHLDFRATKLPNGNNNSTYSLLFHAIKSYGATTVKIVVTHPLYSVV